VPLDGLTNRKSKARSTMVLPVERALRIYEAIADRSETQDSREQLSAHLMKLYADGEKDEHRLTVHGLSYLSELDRRRDSRG
jgi:vacuolar-type H+-ATPase subunit B/Vma2